MGGKGCGGASYPAWEIFSFFLFIFALSTTALNLLWGEATTLGCWETSCLLLRWAHKSTRLLNLVDIIENGRGQR